MSRGGQCEEEENKGKTLLFFNLLQSKKQKEATDMEAGVKKEITQSI